MTLLRQLSRGLRALRHRAEVNAELDEEVRDYFERACADRVRDGLTPEEAERVTRLEFGDAARARETLRAYGWENVVEATLADLRYALRRLRQGPSFTLVAAATLALGIGASTAIFSAVRPILFEPLSYPQGHRIVSLVDQTVDGAAQDVTYGTYIEVAQRSRSFDGLAVATRWQPALVGGGESERLAGDRVSAGYFRVLGVAPAVGRNFEAGDEAVGAPQTVILTDRLAKRRFGSAQAILNEIIQLDGVPHTVIGVMPAGFENVLSPAADAWSALQYRPQAPFASGEWGHHLRMVGRLAAGVSAEEAQREIATIGSTPREGFPRPEWASLERGLLVESLQGWFTAGSRPALFALAGAVLLLLVIAAANVTNLLLARSIARRGELAVRAALGAGRPRLVRQLLTESMLLAVIGGVVGLSVAALGVRAIVALAPAGLPRVEAIHLDLSAFLFAFALMTVVGLAVGLVPALRGARTDLRQQMTSALRSSSGSQQVLRRGLVVAEVALALVLLAGTGLLLRSVDRLFATAPGFDPSNVLTMQVVVSGSRFESGDATLQFFQAARDAVRNVPGVVDAAFSSQLPLSGDFDAYGVRFESETLAYPTEGDGAFRYVVSPDWFRTMDIQLLQGRVLDSRDRPGGLLAVVLSESFAKRRFGDRNPIGERVRIGPQNFGPDQPWDTVVGVVADVKQVSLGLAAPDAFYMAMGQWPWIDEAQSLAVRTRSDPHTLIPAIRDAIWSVDSSPPVVRIVTMDDLLAASEAQRRFVLIVLMIFALASVAMAGLGLYGVIAGSVVERTREIGLRAALGAGRRQIMSLVMRQGMTLAALGVAIGLAGAAATTRGLESLLYGVTALDPLTFAGVVALLAGVCAAACALPAWRAANVDPTHALRSE